MHTYLKSEPGLWTVGHYGPFGKWYPESDHGTQEEAVARVALLNGGGIARELEETADKLSDCWLLLDGLARSPDVTPEIRGAAEGLLRKQKAPGWR